MQHARDDVYCSLVARRAVARAALHLGVADMTAEALHVLSDVLLEYVSRIGSTISHSVEASGRSSAHVNVLDALRATEWCTTHAVTQVHLRGDSSRSEPPRQQQTISDTSWKGLAAFLLGPDWHQGEEEESSEGNYYYVTESSAAGGGKHHGPTTTKAGWHAPYPEEIPLFPVVQNPSLIANPHSLDRETALEQLHSIVMEQPTAEKDSIIQKETPTIPTEEDTIPDTVFQTTWGAVHDNDDDRTKKRKRSMSQEEDTPPPVSKQSKTTTCKEDTSDRTELWLPSYYPPLPRADTQARTVVVPPFESRDSRMESSDPLLVRSSLVQFERPYWGTILPHHRQEGPVVAAGINNDAEEVQPHIVPLGRASGSRVSRILEGSMDVGA